MFLREGSSIKRLLGFEKKDGKHKDKDPFNEKALPTKRIYHDVLMIHKCKEKVCAKNS